MPSVAKAIDPARPGIGKRLVGATGDPGCERVRWYEETVRDEQGRRLRFAMPERVHFGTAVDVAHAAIVEALRDRGTVEAVDTATAIDRGLQAADEYEWSEDPDRDAFAFRVETAIWKLVGRIPNRDDDPAIPLSWLPLADIHVQGMDGESLTMDEPVSGRLLVATPDYLYGHPGEWTGWLDVKTSDAEYRAPECWTGAEATVYDYALTLASGGVFPLWHAYHVYVRSGKPYWTRLEAPVRGAAIGLARRRFERWRLALAGGTVEGLDFTTRWCGDCPWREPIGTIHDGCPIGQDAVTIMEVEV